MLVRNIMPVAICTGVMASSVSNSSAPTQTLMVGSFGCACSRCPRTGSIPRGGNGLAVSELPEGFDGLQPLPVSNTTAATNPRRVTAFHAHLQLGHFDFIELKFYEPFLSIHQ